MPKVDLLVLQPTPFCNIACKYCYLPDRASTEKMTIDTVARICETVFSSGWVGEKLTVAWHAGEPLVVPLNFYEQSFRVINSYIPSGVELRHVFQTNGTLLNKEWCRFFLGVNARVGISIDGPQRIHDLYRLTRAGHGTYERALEGMRMLRDEGIDFYVLTVLTRSSLSQAAELYEFYREERIQSVCFNVEEIEGINRSSSLSCDSIEREFELFLREFWNLNVQHRAIRYIREFNRMFENIISPLEASVRNCLVEPFATLSFDAKGNFATFSPEFLGNKSKKYGNFVLGNVWTSDLNTAKASETLRILEEDINKGVSACRTECEYFSVCGGGAPANKYYENESMATSETMYCRLTVKRVADVAMEIIENSAVNELITAGYR